MTACIVGWSHTAFGRLEGETVESLIVRVAQGALANVVQHAKADSAVVTLTYLADAVTLDVCDDGKGFDPAVPPAAPDRGFGLRAIRQRIEALGGATTVESTPGEGTVLAVSVPIAGEPCPVPAAGEQLQDLDLARAQGHLRRPEPA